MIARMPRSISVGKVDPKLLQPCIDAAFKYGAIAVDLQRRRADRARRGSLTAAVSARRGFPGSVGS